MADIFKKIINEILFGFSGDEGLIEGKNLVDHILEVIEEVLEVAMDPVDMMTLGLLTKFGVNSKHNAAKKKVEKVNKMILEARDGIMASGAKSNTFVGGMIEFNKKSEDKISDEDMIGNIYIFVFAAYDTSRHSSGWSLHFLSRYRQEQKDLVEEAKENNCLKKIDYEKLDELRELGCFFKESLRIGAPFDTSELRKATRKVKLGDFTFERGDLIASSLLVNHFKESTFPAAFVFDRKRHYKPDYHRMSLIPFGAGARGCIGKYLARMNVKMIILVFLRYFDIDSDPKFDITNEGMPFHTLNKVMLRLRLRG